MKTLNLLNAINQASTANDLASLLGNVAYGNARVREAFKSRVSQVMDEVSANLSCSRKGSEMRSALAAQMIALDTMLSD